MGDKGGKKDKTKSKQQHDVKGRGEAEPGEEPPEDLVTEGPVAPEQLARRTE